MDGPELERAIARAEAAFPAVRLDRQTFAAHLARHLPPGAGAAELGALRVEELYLACAAAEGEPAAVALVDGRYFGRARVALESLRGAGGVADEALQQARESLLVAAPGRRPKIADYGGRGDLARFIRTAAMRAAMTLLAPAREVPIDAAALEGYGPVGSDPGIELMKREYGESFRVALREAMARLPAESRDELRLYYIEGLGLEEIGARLGVVASTVWRRLARAREQLREETRRALLSRLRVDDDELESILRMLDTRLELSRSAIAPPEEPGDG